MTRETNSVQIIPLTFGAGRLTGGGEIHYIADSESSSRGTWLVLPQGTEVDQLLAGDFPSMDEIRQVADRLGGHYLTETRVGERSAGWQPSHLAASRLTLQDGSTVLCMSSGPVPTWLRGLAEGASANVVKRLLVAFGTDVKVRPWSRDGGGGGDGARALSWVEIASYVSIGIVGGMTVVAGVGMLLWSTGGFAPNRGVQIPERRVTACDVLKLEGMPHNARLCRRLFDVSGDEAPDADDDLVARADEYRRRLDDIATADIGRDSVVACESLIGRRDELRDAQKKALARWSAPTDEGEPATDDQLVDGLKGSDPWEALWDGASSRADPTRLVEELAAAP